MCIKPNLVRGAMALLGTCVAGSSALGQASPASQTRTVSTETETWYAGGQGDNDSDSAAASTFAPWNVDLSVNSGTGTCTIEALAAQRSSMTPGLISAVGSSSYVFDGGCPTSLAGASAEGTSRFSYVFRVRTTTSYRLTGAVLDTTQYFGSSAYVVLSSKKAGSLFYANSQEHEGAFDVSGQLAPGVYEISGSSSLDFASWNFPTNQPGSAGTSFELVLTLTPPACPCDWNADGAISSPDFFAFLEDFFAGDADFNFNGTTDSQDFFDFLACFFAPPGGCV